MPTRPGLLALFVLGLALTIAGGASAAPIDNGPIRLCRGLGEAERCRSVTRAPLSLGGDPVRLVRTVTVSPAAARDARPLMVVLVAMASSEVRWNGVIIGRNGVVGSDRAHETPGRFQIALVVPPALVRPGPNLVEARLSAQHLPLPVRNPIHAFGVGYYEDPLRLGLDYYLPALLMGGVLALACAWFGINAAMERDVGAGLLAGAAGLALLQLAVESARAFVDYDYPWQVYRVAAIAGLAGLTAIFMAAWAAQRFTPERRHLVGAATVVTVATLTLTIGSYDQKAIYALLAGFCVVSLCGIAGLRRGVAAGRLAVALGVTASGLVLTLQARFLDQAYYLLAAALYASLLAAQVMALSRARAERREAAGRAESLAQTLARRDAATATIRDGARLHRAPVADIVCLKGADDYCEVKLIDGRTLLSTQSLSQTLAELPGDFVRVHKSWAVNARHVVSIGPRAGGRRAVVMSDGTNAPVGRVHAGALSRLVPGA